MRGIVHRNTSSPVTRVGIAIFSIAALTAVFFGFDGLGFALGTLTVGAAICALSEMLESGRLAYRVVEQGASEMGLTPLGAPTAAALEEARAYGQVRADSPGSLESVQPAGR